MSKSYLKTIEKDDPLISEELKRRLKCGIIYTEKTGVFMLENPKLKGDYINFDRAISTQKSRLLDELNSYGRINVLNKNNFIIGPNMLQNVGVMVFE
jgi:hypothetical protein